MGSTSTTVRVEVHLPNIRPEAAFDMFVSDLSSSLPSVGLRLSPGPTGWMYETASSGDEREIARITAWERGRRIAFAWSPFSPELNLRPVEVVFWFEAVDSSTRITLEYGSWPNTTPIEDAAGRMAWIASKLLPPILKSTGPQSFGDWWTDRVARKPSGPDARRTYADPLFHRPNFLLLLDRLHLDAQDRLLEVGCGGGAFLRMALASGCRAVAVDHSPEMVELARKLNGEAVADHRLEVREADATRLPFPAASCTCAVTTGSFGFWDRPVEGLAEVLRVLEPGGRFVLFSGTKELRGTPAAPEPIASRVHWYEDDELEGMARRAGFTSVKVDRPEMGSYARAAGLPPEAVAFFEASPSGAQVLQARKTADRGRVQPPPRPSRRRRKP